METVGSLFESMEALALLKGYGVKSFFSCTDQMVWKLTTQVHS